LRSAAAAGRSGIGCVCLEDMGERVMRLGDAGCGDAC
jgi:hypothetical protein